MLSACIIVQDEEMCIGRALRSICEAVDEIIVLDGGSVDNTVAIAKSFADVTVHEAPFPGDFAEQRNRSIEYANGDWIFALDADEYIERYVGAIFPQLIESGDHDAYAFVRKTIIDGRIINPYDLDYQVRLFRRYCRWEGSYSEQLGGYRNRRDCNLDIKHNKTLAWQQKDNELYWEMGVQPPDGWVKEHGEWQWRG